MSRGAEVNPKCLTKKMMNLILYIYIYPETNVEKGKNPWNMETVKIVLPIEYEEIPLAGLSKGWNGDTINIIN